jgi:hypothetical protein
MKASKSRFPNTGTRAVGLQWRLLLNTNNGAGISCGLEPVVTGYDRLPPGTACVAGV